MTLSSTTPFSSYIIITYENSYAETITINQGIVVTEIIDGPSIASPEPTDIDFNHELGSGIEETGPKAVWGCSVDTIETTICSSDDSLTEIKMIFGEWSTSINDFNSASTIQSSYGIENSCKDKEHVIS